MPYTESDYENAIIELFKGMGYTHLYAPNIERDYTSPLYDEVLLNSLLAINPHLPITGIHNAIYKLKNIQIGSYVQKNEVFMDYLQNGIEISYDKDGTEVGSIVHLIDYTTTQKNTFQVINQWTLIENSERRPDILIFINGLPLIVIELKSPSREGTNASHAYRQLKNYMHEIPSLFVYNLACVLSDHLTSKIGTITANEERFMEWKTKDGSYENTQYAQFDTFFEGIFQQERVLDMTKNFCCYSQGTEKIKILAGYHQYFAVKKAILSTIQATKTDGKGGVFWHSTGSGKSLSMVFYAKLLQSTVQSPTIVVLTDRNDLDNQLYTQFLNCMAFLRQTPEQAQDRSDLKRLLLNRQVNGIIFTTMQKFEESEDALSERKNIIVLADEAHRGQYGLHEKVTKHGKIKIGMARIIRNSLPQASYIAFTGTPISLKDRSTCNTFGNYIDIYDMTQSVEDGATKPVYYESRLINVSLEQKTLELIDDIYGEIAETAPEYSVEKSKKELANRDAILGAEQTINSLVVDIIDHYENYRKNLLTGKAMIVAYSRPIAMKIYTHILRLRPHWNKKLAVVMTSGNDDPPEWRRIIGNKGDKEEYARKFKDSNDPLKIAIVVDMWLTGFDVPSLATMYIYKPMVGHTLIQAISRVNRVFQDKEGGLIVDYIGIASALKHAMNNFTNRDKANYGNLDIQATAYPKFLEKLSICNQIFYGFDYSNFIHGTDLDRGKMISDALNLIIAPDKEGDKKIFIKEALLLKNALSLCSSIVTKENRLAAAFFEAVRTLTLRISNTKTGENPLSLYELNKTINNLLTHSIKSTGVINLFSDIEKEFSLFDPTFLEQLAKIKQKNIAVELLKKLIAEQVFVYSKTNLVKSEEFSKKLQQIVTAYLNGMLTNEEVIEELLTIAKEMAEDEKNNFGLNPEERAFYDALTKPEAVKDFYKNEELLAMTQELTEMLRKNRTIDWQKKESARAGMRKMIKRLLKKYDYPPDGTKDAIDTIIRQCELWTDNTPY